MTRSWDEYYERDLDEEEKDDEHDERSTEERAGEEPPDPSELESWFDDVGAPAKILAFLTSTEFPLSPNFTHDSENSAASRSGEAPAVLDLGTGNGSALLALRLHGGYAGRLVGIDYSAKSIELAEKLRQQYRSTCSTTGTSTKRTKVDNMEFHTYDIINDLPFKQPWWPTSPTPSQESGFDLVLDKGTFDAISLSADTIVDSNTGRSRRTCEVYPRKVLEMVKPGGFLLVTSCNWTEGEVIDWFTDTSAQSEGEVGVHGKFEVHDTIRYRVFKFGGQKGQGVATVCFRKMEDFN